MKTTNRRTYVLGLILVVLGALLGLILIVLGAPAARGDEVDDYVTAASVEFP